MPRHTRYQGFIVHNDHVLLIHHEQRATGHGFWVIPGGGREDGETEEECVVREMLEETNLQVCVERLLFETQLPEGEPYQRLKTYLCTPISGEASPGHEPEPEAAEHYTISAVRWLDLHDMSFWPEDLHEARYTYLHLVRLREHLGYM